MVGREKLEVVEVKRMKKLYCMNCSAQIKGTIPNKCSCGAEFDLADTKNIKKYLQASIILYALLLSLCMFWYRIVQTILVRLELVTMTNIEIK